MQQKHARKRFGQNFLQDETIIHQILQAINPKSEDNLVEIGPGQGALTLPLLAQGFSVTAIEIDRDLISYLKEKISSNALHLISGDALQFDFQQLSQHNKIRVFGNLPYNIATPLLIHLIQFHQQIIDMHFMLQKEVVDRIAASPNTKAYGRLSILLQYFFQTDVLFTVPPTAFYPVPKVWSAVIRLKPYLNSPYEPVNISTLQKVVMHAFATRRKTLKNNLKKILNVDSLADLGIDPNCRPEQLSIEKYIKISNFMDK